MWAEREDGTIVAMGAEAPAGAAVLRIRLPRPAEVCVLCDGVAVRCTRARGVDVDIAARGVYRAEARIGGRLWLLSNPVHLR
jgi:hypothetical protein